MASPTHLPYKHLQSPPAGCEGYLTRRQAARALGFASEFKIREFERKGMLHSVRGPMRAAFYPRPEILALKAQLALSEPGQAPPDAWTDAELLALLGHPKRTGETRTVLDLVMETQISIERAERVYDFWTGRETASMPTAKIVAPAAVAPSVVGVRADSKPPAGEERRAGSRLARDTLIRNLRDPDPRVRAEAFAKLKESEI
jgi:hypothetical protein